MPRWYIVLFFVLLIGNILVFRMILGTHEFKVTVLDVGPPAGGGSAALVHTSSGKTVLIDAGPNASILRALGLALPPWQRRIDAVILTGTRSSLVGGLPAVESRYHISARVQFGGKDTPYGSFFTFDGVRIKIISPATFNISYGSTVFNISSSTPPGVYVLNNQK